MKIRSLMSIMFVLGFATASVQAENEGVEIIGFNPDEHGLAGVSFDNGVGVEALGFYGGVRGREAADRPVAKNSCDCQAMSDRLDKLNNPKALRIPMSSRTKERKQLNTQMQNCGCSTPAKKSSSRKSGY